MATSTSWQEKAAAKRAATDAKIPQKWRLTQTDLDRAKEQVQLTGPFIQSFLAEAEREIVGHDAPTLVKLTSKEYTAFQVAEAYCKTAAIAHQIVLYPPPWNAQDFETSILTAAIFSM
jgi:amidase